MPRFAAVTLPCLRVEIAGGTGPRAVVVARPGGPVQREADLLGATRLDELSHEARALGIRRGDTIAAARAKHAALSVRVVAESAVNETLARLAELALAFGASTSFDAAEDVVFADITGCAHLHGGERPLAERLGARVTALDHACRVAIADGPRVAAAVARHAPASRRGPFVVGPGKNAAAMRVLPLAALPIDDRTIRWLEGLGLLTVGDLQALPPKSLASRIGDHAPLAMSLLRGDDASPITPYRPPATLEERADLEYGVESTDALLFVGKTLCDRVAARLEGRAMGAAKIDLELSLDRALLAEGAPTKDVLSAVIASPLVRAHDLFSVLRARLESYVVSAPVLAVTLRVPDLARIDPRALHLFEPVAKADHTLPRLAAELSAELGHASVGVLRLVDTWVPEARARLVPYGTPPFEPPKAPLTSDAREPTRFLPAPAKILGAPPKLTRVARLESVAWWRDAPCDRELAMAWLDGALAWVEVDRATGETWLRGWVD